MTKPRTSKRNVKGQITINYHDMETRDKIIEFLKTIRVCWNISGSG